MRTFKLSTFNTTLDHLNACLLQMQAENNTVVDFPQALSQEAEQRTADLRSQLDAVMTSRENAQALKASCDAQEAQLIRRIRDAFQLIKRQTRIPDYPEQLFESYGLLRDGTQSRQARELKAPIQMAYQIAAAEAMAVARGFPALTDPTPEELTAMADDLFIMKENLTVARNDERQASEAILGERDAITLLLRKIRMTVKLAMVGKDRITERNLLRSMGFQYGNSPRKSSADDALDAGRPADASPDGAAESPDGATETPDGSGADNSQASLRASHAVRPPAPMEPATDPTFNRAAKLFDDFVTTDAA